MPLTIPAYWFLNGQPDYAALREAFLGIAAGKLTGRAWKSVSYAAAGGPNQVVSASVRSGWVRSPTQATYPSGRTRTAAGAVTAPIAGRSQVPAYSASINRTRSAHGVMSKARCSP